MERQSRFTTVIGFVLSLALITPAGAELIPASRLGDWRPGISVGVPGGIRNRTRIFKTLKPAPANPQFTSANTNAGSHDVNVIDAADFEIGNGVMIENAGYAQWTTNPGPLFTTITAISGNTITLRATAMFSVTGARMTHDDTAAIQDAMDDCPDNQVVFLSRGVYKINRPLITSYTANGYHDNFTLRGEGNDTVLEAHDDMVSVLEVGGGTDYQWNQHTAKVLTSAKKGDSTLNIGDTSFMNDLPNGGVGQIVHIGLLNDPSLPVVSVYGFEGTRREMVRITAKSPTSITIFPALAFDLPTTLKPAISVASHQANFVGIEDLKIEMSYTAAPTALTFEQCYGCWATNVTSNNSAGYHIFFVDCLQCELDHSYIALRQKSGPNGAGIIFQTSCSCLIQDNIIYKIFPEIEVNHGSTGNVFAYNFAEGNDAGGIMGCSFDSNHSPHNSFNLFEGNIGSIFQSDGYFGGDSEETLFRNWFHATSDTTDQYGRTICLNRFARNFSVVGNILGRTGFKYLYGNAKNITDYTLRYIYSFGLPNIGNGTFNGKFAPPWADAGTSPGPGGFQELDSDVEKTTIKKGNWNAFDLAVSTTESLGTDTLPNSLYLTAKPDWFGSLVWPPFDPAKPNMTYEAIPAGYRYLHNSLPIAAPPPQNPDTIVEPAPVSFTQFKNIFSPTRGEKLDVSFLLLNTNDVKVRVLDRAGRLVTTLLEGQRFAGNNVVSWDGQTSDGHPAASGFYIVVLESAGHSVRKKIVLLR